MVTFAINGQLIAAPAVFSTASHLSTRRKYSTLSSSRGLRFNMGGLGAARNILELGAEIRIPVKNTHVYAFAEHSKDVKGNPTAVYRRMGHGSAYGLGVKLGRVRPEYAMDHNCGTGALFLRFGESY